MHQTKHQIFNKYTTEIEISGGSIKSYQRSLRLKAIHMSAAHYSVSMLSSALSGNSCSTRWIRLFIPDAMETAASPGHYVHRSETEHVQNRSGHRQVLKAVGPTSPWPLSVRRPPCRMKFSSQSCRRTRAALILNMGNKTLPAFCLISHVACLIC